MTTETSMTAAETPAGKRLWRNAFNGFTQRAGCSAASASFTGISAPVLSTPFAKP